MCRFRQVLTAMANQTDATLKGHPPIAVVVIATLLAIAQFAWSGEDPVIQTLVWPDGTRYVGGVEDQERSGRGTIFWPDGSRFVGIFKNDLRDGPGTMILTDGRVFNGVFKDDALVGNATIGSQADAAGPSGPVTAARAADAVSAQARQSAAPVTPLIPGPYAPTQAAARARRPDLTNITSTLSRSAALTQSKGQQGQAVKPALTDQVKRELSEVIDAWAAAWQTQDVAGYLAVYAEDFAVPGQQSRRAWEGLRRSRITRPSRINLALTYEKFEMVAAGEAEVSFRQTYRSNLYNDVTYKTLILGRRGPQWRIIAERKR